MFISCPSCGTKLKITGDQQPHKVRCPQCGTVMRVPVTRADEPQNEISSADADALARMLALRQLEDEGALLPPPAPPKSCPSCQQKLPATTVICVKCGYNFQTGQRIRQATPPRPDDATPQQLPKKRRETVTWGDILLCPFESEVLVNTMVVFVSVVFWLLFLLALAFLLAFFGFGAAVFLGAGAAGLVGVVSLLIMIFVAARMYSALIGMYLGVCRAVAHGGMFSGRDRQDGGLQALGYALVVVSIAALPLFLVILSAVRSAGEGHDALSGAFAQYAAGFIPATLWFAFYYPMGLGVVAMENSLNPILVVQWAFKCMPDYFFCLVFTAGFTIGVTIITSWVQTALEMSMRPGAAGLLVFVFTTCVQIYVSVVVFTMLGKILRRNRSRIGWEST